MKIDIPGQKTLPFITNIPIEWLDRFIYGCSSFQEKK